MHTGSSRHNQLAGQKKREAESPNKGQNGRSRFCTLSNWARGVWRDLPRAPPTSFKSPAYSVLCRCLCDVIFRARPFCGIASSPGLIFRVRNERTDGRTDVNVSGKFGRGDECTNRGPVLLVLNCKWAKSTLTVAMEQRRQLSVHCWHKLHRQLSALYIIRKRWTVCCLNFSIATVKVLFYTFNVHKIKNKSKNRRKAN